MGAFENFFTFCYAYLLTFAYVCATEKYNALRAKAATDVSGYFSSLLSGMSQEDRAMIAAAFQKLDDALLQAGTEQSGP